MENKKLVRMLLNNIVKKLNTTTMSGCDVYSIYWKKDVDVAVLYRKNSPACTIGKPICRLEFCEEFHDCTVALVGNTMEYIDGHDIGIDVLYKHAPLVFEDMFNLVVDAVQIWEAFQTL